jgi:ankyrin repeat protein
MDDGWCEKERLHRAASSGDLEEIKALLEEGLPVNAFDDLSRTPLHYAAIGGHIPAVRYLIDAGADPTILGWMTLTALDKGAGRKRP